MARTETASKRRPLLTAFKMLLYAALLGVVALAVAVAVAVASLPSYSQLTKRSDLGQMIRVHAANGAVLVSLGPSFGKWLTYEEIPPSMRSAMIAIDSIRTDLPASPKLDSDGNLSFRFGGRLEIDGNGDGEFRGDVPITVDYL